ncbi:MAG: hypothetical protein HRU19_18890 [Pseudobacteriovorax sp.]|nr:hypothetical protein [Pseudobacteriovorax sp.]
MTGLIWTIQLVHYPSFAFIDSTRFTEFETFHASRISWIVMPVMIVELMTAIGLWFLLAEPWSLWNVINSIGVLLIWLSTGLFSMPIHARLLSGKNTELIRRLVETNWPRTILWSLRSLVLIVPLGRLL